MAKHYRYKTKLYTLAGLADLAGISRTTMYARMKYYGYTVAQAVELPRLARGRPSRSLTYAGQTRTFREWSELTGIPDKTIEARLRNGWSIEQTLCIPSLQQRRAGVVFNFRPSRGPARGASRKRFPK